MPGLSYVHVRLTLQENLLQLVHRKVGEMHHLLAAHSDWPAHRLFRNLRRPHSPTATASGCACNSRISASHSAVYSLAWCGCTPAVANSSPGCARASASACGECSRLAPVTTI